MKSLINWIENFKKNKDSINTIDTKLDEIKNVLIENEKTINKLNQELFDYKTNNAFYIEAINSLPNPIFIKNDKGQFVFFNKKYLDLFGIEKSNYLGKSVLDLDYLPLKDRLKYQKEDLTIIDKGTIVHYESNFKFTDNTTHECFYWSKGFQSQYKKGLIGEIVDISNEKKIENKLSENLLKLKEANKAIKHASQTDPATGVYNRFILNNSDVIDFNKIYSLCVLLLDIDKFKTINDTFGHLAGDKILKEFSNVLKAECRNTDIIIRYGGDEFLILLPDTEIFFAENLANRIVEETKKINIVTNCTQVTASVGISKYIPYETLDDLLLRVDKALYNAKNLGRDQSSVL